MGALIKVLHGAWPSVITPSWQATERKKQATKPAEVSPKLPANYYYARAVNMFVRPCPRLPLPAPVLTWA